MNEPVVVEIGARPTLLKHVSDSLRGSPGNSVTLHQLLDMYLSMGEPGEAVS